MTWMGNLLLVELFCPFPMRSPKCWGGLGLVPRDEQVLWDEEDLQR